MNERRITPEQLAAYERWLRQEERGQGTIEKYLRDVRSFVQWLGEAPVTKEAVSKWRESLLEQQYAPSTINSMLAALNSMFRFAGWDECRVKFLRIQRQIFREQARELSRQDYEKLVATAVRSGRQRLALLMETICSCGIRVSEVPYITVEAARRGRAEISLKGKVRIILLPPKLCRKLLKYARKNKISSGEIFLTRGGNGMSRRQIWAEMKALSEEAGVEPSKVFPHNLRHLFAVAFYKSCGDIVKLADILGHSSIGTTRIYLISTGAEHTRCMERLGLVS